VQDCELRDESEVKVDPRLRPEGRKGADHRNGEEYSAICDQQLFHRRGKRWKA
jgi:hypothetical protein